MTFPLKNMTLKGLLTLVILVATTVVSAQSEGTDVYLRIYGTVVERDNNENLEECVVKVQQNGTFLEEYQTKYTGKYEFFLPTGYKYRFFYEKDGFVGKNIEIDCVDAASMDDQFIFSLKADISLFKEINGMDYTVLNDPIGKGICNGRKGKVQFDKEYTRSMEERISSLYVPTQANTSENNRVTIEETITDVPEEDDEITVKKIFEEAEKENEQLAYEEVEPIKEVVEITPVTTEEIINDIPDPEIVTNEITHEVTEVKTEEITETIEVVEEVKVPEKIEVVEETVEVMEETIEMVEETVETTENIEEPKKINPVTLVESEPYNDKAKEFVWRVQIGAYNNNNIDAFYGISNVDFITGLDGITRCFAGYFDTPLDAAKHKVALINKGYTDAFLAVFKGHEQISIQESGISLDHISYTKLKEQLEE